MSWLSHKVVDCRILIFISFNVDVWTVQGVTSDAQTVSSGAEDQLLCAGTVLFTQRLREAFFKIPGPRSCIHFCDTLHQYIHQTFTNHFPLFHFLGCITCGWQTRNLGLCVIAAKLSITQSHLNILHISNILHLLRILQISKSGHSG